MPHSHMKYHSWYLVYVQMRIYRVRVPLFVPLLNLSASIGQMNIFYNNFKYISPKSEIGFIFKAFLNILGDRL